jgi:hypothetical protein
MQNGAVQFRTRNGRQSAFTSKGCVQKLRAQTTPSVRYCSLATELLDTSLFAAQGIWPLIATNCKGGHVTTRSLGSHRKATPSVSKESRHPYLSQLSLAQVIHPRDKLGRCVRYRKKNTQKRSPGIPKGTPEHACVFILCAASIREINAEGASPGGTDEFHPGHL